MANISSKDCRILERFLGMGSGYVLDFSNSTYAAFFQEEMGLDIDDFKYLEFGSSNSKARRMRKFWQVEEPQTVSKLIKKLIQHRLDTLAFNRLSVSEDESRDIAECERIADKLLGNTETKIVEPKLVLSNDYIQQTVNKINERVKNEDFDGAVTASRTLIEEVLVEVFKSLKNGEAPEYDGDMNKLNKLVLPLLSLSPSKEMDERLRIMLQGLLSINNGVASLRNLVGDAHAKKYRLASHHAQLVVNSTFTFCQFMCDTFLYQTKSVRNHK